jgi:hypothetical protein
MRASARSEEIIMSASMKSMLCAASVGLALATPVQAAEPPEQAATPAATADSNAMTVVRDPDTGVLRAPTAAEHAALQSQLKAKNARIAPAVPLRKFHPNGATGARLTDEFASSAVAVRGTDGKLAEQCVDSGDAAQDAVVHVRHNATKLETE